MARLVTRMFGCALLVVLGTACQSGGSVTSLTCDAAATELPGEPGTSVTVACPAGCTLGMVWGTNTYSDDSLVCSAAVHAGAIPLEGGETTVQIAAGLPAYVGSASNGVTSSDWGSWARSFTFPEAVAVVPEPAAAPEPELCVRGQELEALYEGEWKFGRVRSGPRDGECEVNMILEQGPEVGMITLTEWVSMDDLRIP